MAEINAPAEAVTPVGINHLVINVRDIEEFAPVSTPRSSG